MTTALMTVDAVGGVWSYALELAEALRPHDVDITFAVLGPEMNAAQREAVKRSAVVEVHECSLALEWMPHPWRDVDAAGEWLLDLEAQLKPDVVHLNGYSHAALPWRAPTAVVAHSCVLSWWAAVRREPAPPDYDEYRRRVTEGLQSASVVIAPSAAMRADLRHFYRHDGGIVIHNGRRPLPRSEDGMKKSLVVGAGRVWDDAKQLRSLARVAERASWPVVIAGDATGPDGSATADDSAATFAGRLDEERLGALLAEASIFVLPAKYEPFGLGPLEAALAGCALVLGDIDSLREIWGDAATYVTPGDDDALAKTLEALIADPPRARRLAQRARRCAARYSAEAMAARYAEVYDLLIRRGVAA